MPSSRPCSTRRWQSWSPPPSGRTCSYRVTILNSPAVNAFALPSGQLYVTRGLIALANDTSELASVLAHEMAHVIAQPRRRSARTRRARWRWSPASFTDLRQRSGDRRAGAGQVEDHAGELLARAGIRGRRHRRRHRGARRLRPLRRGALPHLDGTQRRRSRPAQPVGGDRSARARFPLLASGDAGARQATPQANARQFTAPGAGQRDTDAYLARHRRPGLRRGPERRLRARPPLPASAARLHLHGAGGLRARQHRAGGVRRQGRRRPGAAPRRRARAGRADARRLSHLRLDRERRAARASRSSPSAASRRRPPPPRATSGRSGSTRCGSAATSIASSSPPSA